MLNLKVVVFHTPCAEGQLCWPRSAAYDQCALIRAADLLFNACLESLCCRVDGPVSFEPTTTSEASRASSARYAAMSSSMSEPSIFGQAKHAVADAGEEGFPP